jgi:hypothetical protein
MPDTQRKHPTRTKPYTTDQLYARLSPEDGRPRNKAVIQLEKNILRNTKQAIE